MGIREVLFDYFEGPRFLSPFVTGPFRVKFFSVKYTGSNPVCAATGRQLRVHSYELRGQVHFARTGG